MALTYLETSALMTDTDFHNRSKVACLHFAAYIDGESEDTPAHNTRMNWARQTFQAPDNSVTTIMPALVMDPKVQADGGAITDADLQSAVETVVNKMF
jgi:hypothetical protein